MSHDTSTDTYEKIPAGGQKVIDIKKSSAIADNIEIPAEFPTENTNEKQKIITTKEITRNKIIMAFLIVALILLTGTGSFIFISALIANTAMNSVWILGLFQIDVAFAEFFVPIVTVAIDIAIGIVLHNLQARKSLLKRVLTGHPTIEFKNLNKLVERLSDEERLEIINNNLDQHKIEIIDMITKLQYHSLTDFTELYSICKSIHNLSEENKKAIKQYITNNMEKLVLLFVGNNNKETTFTLLKLMEILYEEDIDLFTKFINQVSLDNIVPIVSQCANLQLVDKFLTEVKTNHYNRYSAARSMIVNAWNGVANIYLENIRVDLQ